MHAYKQETQLSLTNRATHLCKCNGVTDLKHAPLLVLPRRIWSFCVKGVGINTEEPPKFRIPGTAFSWNGRRGWPYDTRHPHIYCPSNLV